jgi:osmotically-inducible protein OsmY
MEDVPALTKSAARQLYELLPETLEEAEELAALIEQAVQRETDFGVQDLRVVVEDHTVELSGRCDSFYCKQVAQHVAMSLFRGERFINGIEVAY